jgi:2-polyprenyl-6-methoxyphenol hydroxylase-like FAD-dependent oxidoreductase
MTTDPAPRQVGKTAVVVGASMAGLCAATVLAQRFGQVLVFDRDALPEAPEPRGQVPQGRHPHLLLVAGGRLLEGWFPGLNSELMRVGAVDIDVVGDVSWYQSGGFARRPASGLHGPAMSRPLLEHTVRARVQSLPNVTIRGATAVLDLVADGSGERIRDVRLADGTLVPCDLVVDATGRSARSLAWLSNLGFSPPPVTAVHVDMRYVSRIYRRSPPVDRDWKGAAVIDHPSAKRMAVALPIEGDRWFVTFAGLNGVSPPTHEDERLAWARSLPSPLVADVMEKSEPLGPPVTHRFPANQRRQVKRMRRFPLGWVLLGDAVCSFDPVYGQGMSSAALQAVALADCLDRAGAIDRAFARRYFRAVSRTVAVPWSLAVGADFMYDGTTGHKPPATDLLNRYMERVRVAAQHDDKVAIGMIEVFVLVRPPGALFRPSFMLRVLRGSRRGPVRTPTTARPVEGGSRSKGGSQQGHARTVPPPR